MRERLCRLRTMFSRSGPRAGCFRRRCCCCHCGVAWTWRRMAHPARGRRPCPIAWATCHWNRDGTQTRWMTLLRCRQQHSLESCSPWSHACPDRRHGLPHEEKRRRQPRRGLDRPRDRQQPWLQGLGLALGPGPGQEQQAPLRLGRDGGGPRGRPLSCRDRVWPRQTDPAMARRRLHCRSAERASWSGAPWDEGGAMR